MFLRNLPSSRNKKPRDPEVTAVMLKTCALQACYNFALYTKYLNKSRGLFRTVIAAPHCKVIGVTVRGGVTELW
jgi:hypothetical protein